jgi:hypothetical protein
MKNHSNLTSSFPRKGKSKTKTKTEQQQPPQVL